MDFMEHIYVEDSDPADPIHLISYVIAAMHLKINPTAVSLTKTIKLWEKFPEPSNKVTSMAGEEVSRSRFPYYPFKSHLVSGCLASVWIGE
jgi:hypothetical protein